MITQEQLIHDFAEQNTPQINKELFVRSEDAAIRELQNVILSCQRNKFFTIKVVKFRVVEDYFEIQEILRNYDETSFHKNKSSRKRENQYDYINLKDSDIKLLIVSYCTSIKGVYRYLDVIIAVPRIVDKFYLRLSGSIYSAIYQIVETSTYNNTTSNTKKHCITFRTILANLRMYRGSLELKTTDKEKLKCTFYSANVFDKSLPAMEYIFAKYGYYETLNVFSLPSRIFKITQTEFKDPDWYTFARRDDIFISVPKYLFDNNQVIQCFVYTIYKAIDRSTVYEEIFTKEFWLRELGSHFAKDTVEKGMNVLDSIEHIYDESTRAMIRLPEELKHNIYCILKWLICEFSNLRVKDNLDLATKRIRFAEYIAAMYAAKLSKGIYRIADLGNKADLNSIQKAINIRPMYLIEEIQKSRLVNYRNMVNDSDGFAALKFTYKGIAGIGEKSQNSVANVFRAVNPSHLGRLDLNSSSATDPGLSGVLCPLCQIQDDGFFDNYKEPIFWEEDIAKLLNEYKDRVGKKEIFEFKRKLSILDIDTPEPETEIELIKFIKPERFDTGIVEPGIPLEDGGVIRYGN